MTNYDFDSNQIYSFDEEDMQEQSCQESVEF